jgi:hypothetical protein|nr:MAG TPA: hypothetical protein [Caudoviricetes sp.]
MESVLIYKPDDFRYLKKYYSEEYLKNASKSDFLDAMNEKIMEVGFDDKLEFYNDEGKKLQEIYDNIYYMN